ncbi:MAG: helix-turn-helix domain containing protein [Emcibacteraceae bacterium]|nr:helix-turn-helix domain containing protein [Emcibacteraceae bacterium]MDG1995633.1 helix-turn-helix domain containing protein [Emcibacteraceae bacterium]
MVRGRPRKTDPEEALKAAMIIFWEKGYDATSMSDLVEATGMAKPGLYATFGDKQEFYKKALESYVNMQRNVHMPKLFSTASSAKGTFEAFFNSILDTMSNPTLPNGCLLANTLAKSENEQPSLKVLAKKYHKMRRDGFYESLRLAQRDGRLSKENDIEQLADFLSAQVLTLCVLHKTGEDEEGLRAFINMAMMLFKD